MARKSQRVGITFALVRTSEVLVTEVFVTKVLATEDRGSR
jgi:hypothetical protein